jgi:hypothetical protein
VRAEREAGLTGADASGRVKWRCGASASAWRTRDATTGAVGLPERMERESEEREHHRERGVDGEATDARLKVVLQAALAGEIEKTGRF